MRRDFESCKVIGLDNGHASDVRCDDEPDDTAFLCSASPLLAARPLQPFWISSERNPPPLACSFLCYINHLHKQRSCPSTSPRPHSTPSFHFVVKDAAGYR